MKISSIKLKLAEFNQIKNYLNGNFLRSVSLQGVEFQEQIDDLASLKPKLTSLELHVAPYQMPKPHLVLPEELVASLEHLTLNFCTLEEKTWGLITQRALLNSLTVHITLTQPLLDIWQHLPLTKLDLTCYSGRVDFIPLRKLPLRVLILNCHLRHAQIIFEFTKLEVLVIKAHSFTDDQIRQMIVSIPNLRELSVFFPSNALFLPAVVKSRLRKLSIHVTSVHNLLCLQDAVHLDDLSISLVSSTILEDYVNLLEISNSLWEKLSTLKEYQIFHRGEYPILNLHRHLPIYNIAITQDFDKLAHLPISLKSLSLRNLNRTLRDIHLIPLQKLTHLTELVITRGDLTDRGIYYLSKLPLRKISLLGVKGITEVGMSYLLDMELEQLNITSLSKELLPKFFERGTQVNFLRLAENLR